MKRSYLLTALLLTAFMFALVVNEVKADEPPGGPGGPGMPPMPGGPGGMPGPK